MSRHPVLALFALPLLLSACAPQDEAAYPRLLPLSELNKAPAIPAHAADAAADPQAVGQALDARRAEAESRARAARRPVTDAEALGDRASALRRRAEALAAAEMPTAETPTAPPHEDGTPPAAGSAPAEAATDPGTAARVRALRERARALSEQPVTGAPLPPCPPGTTDPAAARCTLP